MSSAFWRSDVSARALPGSTFTHQSKWYGGLSLQRGPMNLHEAILFARFWASAISVRDFYGKSRTIRPRSYRFLHKGKVEMLNLYPEIAVPFVFNGVTYASVGDLDRASLRTGEQMISSGFLVIARYLGNVEAYEGAFKAKARAKKLTPAKTLTEKEMLQIQEEFFKTVCVMVR